MNKLRGHSPGCRLPKGFSFSLLFPVLVKTLGALFADADADGDGSGGGGRDRAGSRLLSPTTLRVDGERLARWCPVAAGEGHVKRMEHRRNHSMG